MIDKAGRFWDIFKTNVKLNPFSFIVYFDQWRNGYRPIRSAIMGFALISGLITGGVLAVTIEPINLWIISLIDTFIPSQLVGAFNYLVNHFGDVIIQICAFGIGAYIGNALTGTVLKQLWRFTNKIFIGSTNSFYNLSGKEFETIRAQNLEYFEPPIPQPEFEHFFPKLAYHIIKNLPLQWLKPGGFLAQYVPTSQFNQWYELFELIQQLRLRKKNLKHSARGDEQLVKYSLQTLINDKDAHTLYDYLINYQNKLQQRLDRALKTLDDLTGLCEGSSASNHGLETEQAVQLSTLTTHYNQILDDRSRYSVPNNYEASLSTVHDLNLLKKSAQLEENRVRVKLNDIESLLKTFKFSL